MQTGRKRREGRGAHPRLRYETRTGLSNKSWTALFYSYCSSGIFPNTQFLGGLKNASDSPVLVSFVPAGPCCRSCAHRLRDMFRTNPARLRFLFGLHRPFPVRSSSRAVPAAPSVSSCRADFPILFCAGSHCVRIVHPSCSRPVSFCFVRTRKNAPQPRHTPVRTPLRTVFASAASSERQIPTVSKAIIRSAARPRFRIFTARSHSRTTAAHLPVHTPPRAFRSTSSAVPSAPARAAFRTFALSVPDSFSSSIRGPERFTSTLFPKTAPGSRFPTPRPPSAPTDSPVRLSAPALPFRAPGLPFPPAFVQTTRQTARRKPVAAERRAGGRRQIPRPAEYRNVYGTVLRMKLLCRKNCRLGDNADDSQRDGPQLRFP